MVVKSKVVDSVTQEPIGGANIALSDIEGNLAKVLAPTDSKGQFSVDSSALDYWDDVFVQVSEVGYTSEFYYPDQLPAVVQLKQDVKDAGGVTVTAKKPTVPKKVSYLLPALLGASALVSIGMFFYKTYG